MQYARFPPRMRHGVILLQVLHQTEASNVFFV
jgi:hypothetical protein